MTCCTGGDCCGPGSYCCANTGPHDHPEIDGPPTPADPLAARLDAAVRSALRWRPTTLDELERRLLDADPDLLIAREARVVVDGRAVRIFPDALEAVAVRLDDGRRSTLVVLDLEVLAAVADNPCLIIGHQPEHVLVGWQGVRRAWCGRCGTMLDI